MKAPLIVATALVIAAAAASPAHGQDAGYALQFDGTTDQVRLHATNSMMAATWPTTKTVSLWVNPTGTSTCTANDPGACDVIFGDRPRTWGISRGPINGEDRIWVWNYDGNADRVGVEYTPGEWTQITLVHAEGVLSAYKDGLFVGSVASGPTAQGGNQVLHFGGIINNASRNWTFEGEIDEVQIWNLARDATEIADSMSGPLAGSESGLAAYYRMTDGPGSTSVTDDSPGDWTGSLLDGGSGVPGNGPINWVPSGAFSAGPIEPNTPPVAYSQDVTTSEDTPAAVMLAGFDADGNPLSFRVTVPPAYGVLTGTAPNLTYVPAANVYGTDGFEFVANDGFADSTPATVSLTVLPVNDAPVAGNDGVVTAIETAVTIAVLANDADVDGGLLSITEVTQPLHGTASNQVDQVIYTPEAGFTGADSFTYTIADGQGGFGTATVTVTVTQAGADPGDALSFDGVSDFVTLSKTANMFAAGWEVTKTVSLWVKPTGTPYCLFPNPASCDAIFGDRPRWWGISRGVIGGLDRIWVWNFDGALQAIAIPYTPGEWLHVALVHGGGMLSAYRNGVLVGSMASGATQQPSTGALPVLQLGGVINNASRNWTFEGEIDEVQLWNTARTTEEIQQDMSWPLTGNEGGLAAYYRMTDGSGSMLTDDSGHGFTGTLWDGGTFLPPDGPIQWVPSGAFSVLPPQ
ncbi:MAG: Ig-like domain-containing protein [Vicinamibacterales bacterium]